MYSFSLIIVLLYCIANITNHKKSIVDASLSF